MIGVRLGNTGLTVARVAGAHLAEVQAFTFAPAAGPETILETIALAALAIEPKPVGVGIAIPGGVDSAGRCWRMPNLPGFEGLFLADRLASRLACPVAVENDATAAALGEKMHGRGRDRTNFMVMSLRTGIGGGFIIGGELYRGTLGLSGEIGHAIVDNTLEAAQCVCGLRGCLEAYAGARAMVRRFQGLGGAGEDVRGIIAGAVHGEAAAIRTLAVAADAIGAAISLVQNLLDLEAVLFSSTTPGLLAWLEPGIRGALRRQVFGKPPSEVQILESGLGEAAELVGAVEVLRMRITAPNDLPRA